MDEFDEWPISENELKRVTKTNKQEEKESLNKDIIRVLKYYGYGEGSHNFYGVDGTDDVSKLTHPGGYFYMSGKRARNLLKKILDKK